MLHQQADAHHKLVMGHHPVHPVNGFSGPYQRQVGPEHAQRFWAILVEADVLAYLCSHILAFDVQVHRGVLQICTAGAGTAHRMPEGVEYLHCVQAALDTQGLRYQVLDTAGLVRERLEWPMPLLAEGRCYQIPLGEGAAPFTGRLGAGHRVEFRLQGCSASRTTASAQTLVSAFAHGCLASFWLGLRGPEQRLTLIMGKEPGRSPHYWTGPVFPTGEDFDIHLAIVPDMGPGGVLWRRSGCSRWTSLSAASPTGPEELEWPERWSIGQGQHGSDDRRFCGSDLKVSVIMG